MGGFGALLYGMYFMIKNKQYIAAHKTHSISIFIPFIGIICIRDTHIHMHCTLYIPIYGGYIRATYAHKR